MSSENITFKVKEARDMLADINDLIEQISQWCLNNAGVAISKLQDKWAITCSTAKSTKLDIFIQQCENLLADCETFQNHIDEKSMNFSDTIEIRLPLIKKLAGNDNDTSSLIRQVSRHWNETVQPQLVFLYKKLEELELSIRDMMAS